MDLNTAGSDIATFSATLKLVASDPYQLKLMSLQSVKTPGGNRAQFHGATKTVSIPSVNIEGLGDFYAELEQVPGTDPAIYKVTTLEDISGKKVFNRIASFPVYLNTDIESETVSEIVDVSKDGNTLIYTDGENGNIGFVDITNPADPEAAGTVAVDGEPTSVAVFGDFALAAVNTSPSFTEPSGVLNVIDIATQSIVKTLDLGGQPDAVAVSPDGKYAAIIIENERDEDLGEGEPPQAPAGFLVIVDLTDDPETWSLRTVSLTDVAKLFPEDPEPEYVDINSDNIAVVTLQENNHIALVDLESGEISADFSAGSVDLSQIDTQEEDPALISLVDLQFERAREPDGVSWMGVDWFATANEGDLFGGSRGFSVFDLTGNVIWDSGNSMEHDVVSIGHYPDARSKNKGNEPENIEYATFEGEEYLFVASERSNVVFAYNLIRNSKQILPAGVGPEGLKAIPERNLLIAASEKDARGDKFRSVLNIYQLQNGGASYPAIVSNDRLDGTPIPWSALSGLAMDRESADIAYSVHDSFYQKSRIFVLNVGSHPATINKEIILKDNGDILADAAANMVNDDKTVNLDLEGIATSADGGFWLVSEGVGTIGDADRPVETLDLLIHADAQGTIDQLVMLPETTNNRQLRFGFEGVAATGSADTETLYIAFQREWMDDPEDQVRIGKYDVAAAEWTFFYYPLDAAESDNGGWVGLSDITAINDSEFAVIERDNQGGVDAAVKRLYTFSIDGLTPLADSAVGVTPEFPVVSKTLLLDIIPTLQATGGMVLEKLEGLAITADNEILMVNDNDGVDDSNGETQLFRLPGLLD